MRQRNTGPCNNLELASAIAPSLFVRSGGVGRTAGPSRGPLAAMRSCLVLLLTLAISACSIEPQTIQLGSEECSHCRMVISEQRFTAQALNRQGRAFSFDAIECMADWVAAGEAVAVGRGIHRAARVGSCRGRRLSAQR